ncbi:MAG: hypothetical protein HY939_07040 [Gammaproteobacteria bacterium]|nr:hypothetical protein [Gammaproteobacteria bacterium]
MLLLGEAIQKQEEAKYQEQQAQSGANSSKAKRVHDGDTFPPTQRHHNHVFFSQKRGTKRSYDNTQATASSSHPNP